MQQVQLPIEQNFDGVIFDCDGTLVDTMPLHFRAWQGALAGQPFQFEEALFYELGGVPSTQIVRIINEKHGVRLDPESAAARKEELYLNLLPEARPIQCVVDLVYQYRGKYPLAVASGGIRSVVIRTVEALNLLDYFDVIATAEDVEHGKPAPDLFLFAAAQMGIDPHRCLVYEDSPLGLQAAERAGMHGIDIRTLLPPPTTIL
ncbi:MAG: HAD family phosphatase [Armatimonadota bacterium]|nr:HAD family phosphatase [Armatimonadota bacterium]